MDLDSSPYSCPIGRVTSSALPPSFGTEREINDPKY